MTQSSTFQRPILMEKTTLSVTAEVQKMVAEKRGSRSKRICPIDYATEATRASAFEKKTVADVSAVNEWLCMCSTAPFLTDYAIPKKYASISLFFRVTMVPTGHRAQLFLKKKEGCFFTKQGVHDEHGGR